MSAHYANKPVILHGRSHPAFAESLVQELGWAHVPVKVQTFSDGETHVVVQESVEDADVYLVQPTSSPTNDTLMELLLMANAAQSMKPKRITAVMPFFGYRRQEKRSTSGEALSFELVAQMMKAAGIDRVLVMDLHKHRSLHFFAAAGIEYNELRAFETFVECLQKDKTEGLVIVAPDKGRVPEASDYASALGIPLIIATKHRDIDQKDHVFFDELIADVQGKDVVIVDDEVNTAGTLLGVAKMMKDQGANNIIVACTHPVLSGPAIERLSKAPISKFYTTDTIVMPEEKMLPMFEVVSVIQPFVRALRDWADTDAYNVPN